MKPFKSLTVVEQLAAHLKEGILEGELRGNMPGSKSLGASLGVSSNTVTAAVELLEREGFLKPQGHGRRNLIVLPEDFIRPQSGSLCCFMSAMICSLGMWLKSSSS